MTTPNLFKFATSELSQDAFICWLLSWADKKYKVGNDKQQSLNRIAIQLLELLFEKSGKKLPQIIETLEVKRQVKNIDILCVINETYCVLIEDKVGTVQHSEQLTRYLEFVKNDYKQTFTEEFIVPIYLQTHDQSCYKKALEDGFYCVNRQDLLSIFPQGNEVAYTHSDIYTDFVDYLQNLENAVQSFRTLPVAEWKKRSWIGFFQYLQTIMETANWDYVPNRAGGFMGLWGFTQHLEDVIVYLQLEQDKICFKMCMTDKVNRRKKREELNQLFITEASLFNLQVTKPDNFGSGTHMTFAVLRTEVINKSNPHPIDLRAVDTLMTTLNEFIIHCVNKYEAKSVAE
jgi:hypothetical protein